MESHIQQNLCHDSLTNQTHKKDDHFTAKPKVGLLRNVCQGQGKCRSDFYFFQRNRHP
ncbi:MAG: hypothetical protein OJF59_001748 [Cytophagales bacterium]|nr:MAG: hypothetical protein OJF59_001748 [Cytophagales bacterium]